MSQLKAIKSKAQGWEEAIELWNKRFLDAPGYPKLMASREEAWERKERVANTQALRILRTYIPADINKLAVPELMKCAADEGVLYTTDFATYLKSKRLLWWVITHPGDAAKQNFLQGANVGSFRDIADYDILEVRAARRQPFAIRQSPVTFPAES